MQPDGPGVPQVLLIFRKKSMVAPQKCVNMQKVSLSVTLAIDIFAMPFVCVRWNEHGRAKSPNGARK